MRHAATFALLSRKDVIIVASVSCIYGIGDRDTYEQMTCEVDVGTSIDRDSVLRRLVELQYERNGISIFTAGRSASAATPSRCSRRTKPTPRPGSSGGAIRSESISEIDPMRGAVKCKGIDRAVVFPASHYATPSDTMRRACETIRVELKDRLEELSKQGKLLERQRLEQRTMYDLEAIEQMGFCSGIENYSRHLTGRKPGEPPPTLMDYFGDDYLLIIDESHQTVPQIGAMYNGDRSRKETLVEFGFRLPSALDNRPLRFDEWRQRARQTLYVSATPAEWELAEAKGVVVDQIIRPTGLLDPVVEIRPVAHQVDDLLAEIRLRVAAGERVLVTTLTKRMSEDLSEYYREIGVKVRYLHSDVDTLERIQIIRDLRRGEFDVLVGINLLREGLDIPEVSLVGILDADKEGFLRSERSLIQTIGRASRNVNGKVLLYADKETASIRDAWSARSAPAASASGDVQPRARDHASIGEPQDHGDADRRAAPEEGAAFCPTRGGRSQAARQPRGRAHRDRQAAARDAAGGERSRVRAGRPASRQSTRARAARASDAMMQAINGFYAVLDRDDESLARALIAGGARILQVRVKPAGAAELLRIARMARSVCDELGAALVVNDRVDVALAVAGADAVHLGQTDVSIAAARGLGKLAIGVSTHDVAQVELAVAAGADYLGFGPIFATSTKEHPDPVQGIGGLRAAVAAARGTPIVAIGGITPAHASALYAAGVAAVCAIGAVNRAADVAAVARSLGRNMPRSAGARSILRQRCALLHDAGSGE